MSSTIQGIPPKPDQFGSLVEWAARLADFLELQGDNLATAVLTGLPATPVVMGFQQITGLAGVTSLVVPTGTLVAYIQVEGQNVRWRDDGVNPSVSVGNLIYAQETLVYGGNFSKLRLIEIAPTAVVNIEYRR